MTFRPVPARDSKRHAETRLIFFHQQINGKWQCSYEGSGISATGELSDNFTEAHSSLLEAIADKIVLNDPWKQGKE